MTIKHLIIALVIISFCACKKEPLFQDQTEHHFFLKNDNAIMPVHVRGNTNSKIFILVLHGGPGSSAIQNYKLGSYFESLEQDYAVLYWDQRCAGLSQGNCDPSELLVDNYVNDLEQLTVLMKSIYGQESTYFLFGHSWGGTLGMAYLAKDNNQENYHGFINVDGPHNYLLTAQLEKRTLLNFSNKMITENNRVEEWSNLKTKIENEDAESLEGLAIINRACYNSESILAEMDSVSSSNNILPAIPFLSNSSLSKTNQNSTDDSNSFYDENYFFNLDLTPDLGAIKIPVSLIWGKYDFVIPTEIGMDIYDHLGTDQKEITIFSRSHHSPMVSENEKFQNKVTDFIEAYK